MITDFPNNLRQFVYLSRYAPPTPEALTSNLSVPKGAGERCCASCKRKVTFCLRRRSDKSFHKMTRNSSYKYAKIYTQEVESDELVRKF